MTANLDKVKALAIDLRTGIPRSPREKLDGYVIFGRAIDKARAEVAGVEGDYEFDCALSRAYLQFVDVTPGAFKEFVATGATDAEIVAWVKATGKTHTPGEVVKFNNEWREKRLSEMPEAVQLSMERALDNNVPPGTPIYTWFDIFDAEEGRITSTAI